MSGTTKDIYVEVQNKDRRCTAGKFEQSGFEDLKKNCQIASAVNCIPALPVVMMTMI